MGSKAKPIVCQSRARLNIARLIKCLTWERSEHFSVNLLVSDKSILITTGDVDVTNDDYIGNYSNRATENAICDDLAPNSVAKQLSTTLGTNQIPAAVQEYESGKSLAWVAKKYNLSKWGARKMLAKKGVEIRSIGRERAEIPSAIEDYESGKSLTVICKEHNISKGAARDWLEGQGVEIRGVGNKNQKSTRKQPNN